MYYELDFCPSELGYCPNELVGQASCGNSTGLNAYVIKQHYIEIQPYLLNSTLLKLDYFGGERHGVDFQFATSLAELYIIDDYNPPLMSGIYTKFEDRSFTMQGVVDTSMDLNQNFIQGLVFNVKKNEELFLNLDKELKLDSSYTLTDLR